MNDRRRILDLKGISTAFAGKSALADVSLSLDEGQAVGLVGENGAGKSTLLKIIRADSGSIAVRGREVELRSYQDANKAGIFHIYQDLVLVPTMFFYENVLLSHEARFSRFGATSIIVPCGLGWRLASMSSATAVSTSRAKSRTLIFPPARSSRSSRRSL